MCHLTTVHQPFDIRIFQKECQALVRAGYDVSLVAVHEKDETVDGVRVFALDRPVGRMQRWLATRRQCLSRAVETGAELFHFHDPELIPVGLKLKKLGKKVIYDVHESHALSILDRAYLHPMVRSHISRRLAALEREADKRLDAIVPATPKIARQFRNRRTVLVQNYPMLGELAPPADRPFAERGPALAYLGGVSAIRGAREMVAALALVPEARLVVIGEFTPESLKAELMEHPGWGQVEALGWQDREGVAQALARCVGGVVLFHPLRNHVESQPNKLFEYMSAGLPVLASDFPYWREIVTQEDCGLLVDPMDVHAIAEGFRRLVNDRESGSQMGDRGLSAVRNRYNWPVEEAKLLALYAELLS